MPATSDFTGYEIEVGARFSLPAGELQLSLARDEVDAEFSNGEDVPRIVPARNIFTARYTLDDFSAKVLVKDVERQTSVAPGESVTDGFTLVNADASWSYGFEQLKIKQKEGLTHENPGAWSAGPGQLLNSRLQEPRQF